MLNKQIFQYQKNVLFLFFVEIVGHNSITVKESIFDLEFSSW